MLGKGLVVVKSPVGFSVGAQVSCVHRGCACLRAEEAKCCLGECAGYTSIFRDGSVALGRLFVKYYVHSYVLLMDGV